MVPVEPGFYSGLSPACSVTSLSTSVPLAGKMGVTMSLVNHLVLLSIAIDAGFRVNIPTLQNTWICSLQ